MPATYGNFYRVLDLVDEWDHQKLFWGDKGALFLDYDAQVPPGKDCQRYIQIYSTAVLKQLSWKPEVLSSD